jgi:hypothetical protein
MNRYTAGLMLCNDAAPEAELVDAAASVEDEDTEELAILLDASDPVVIGQPNLSVVGAGSRCDCDVLHGHAGFRVHPETLGRFAVDEVASNSRRLSGTFGRAGVSRCPYSSVVSVGSSETGQWRRVAFCALCRIAVKRENTALLRSFDEAADQGVEVYGVVLAVAVRDQSETTRRVDDIAGTAYRSVI